MNDNQSIDLVQELMDSFARRTGLTGSEGNLQQRYLWTDAFAVQSFLGLAERLDEANYRTYALDLIETVYSILFWVVTGVMMNVKGG